MPLFLEEGFPLSFLPEPWALRISGSEYSVQLQVEKGRDRKACSCCCLEEKSSFRHFQEVNMPGPLSALQISMSDQTRTLLHSWVRRPKTPSGLVRRARALLLLEQGSRYTPTAKPIGLTERNLRKWARRFLDQGVAGLREQSRPGRAPVFSPQVALYVVKLACERPDQVGRSLSHWNCSELARQLKADGIVPSISIETIRGILQSHKLKPWRSHLWLSRDPCLAISSLPGKSSNSLNSTRGH